MKDKLQDPEILEFILKFDIVWILEAKKYFNSSVPGFTLYRNVSREGQHRGGIVMLVKSKLAESISRVDTETEGQMWVVFSWWPNMKLGGVYIPPEDSPYYQPVHFGTLARHAADSDKVVVMGDFNSRVGTPRIKDKNDNMYSYGDVSDIVVNEHGKSLINVCNNNALVVANHLHHRGRQLGGDLSFKRRQNWISEIDLCIVKEDCLDLLQKVYVNQEIPGSDHAPLCVTLSTDSWEAASPHTLLQRASSLGQHHYLQKKEHRIKKSVSYKEVDLDRLTSTLQAVAPPILEMYSDATDVEEAIKEGCRVITETAASHTRQGTTDADHHWDQAHPRWKRLLNTNDTKLIWKSINWKGNIENDSLNIPNDDQFKEHFEHLLGSQNVLDDDSFVNSPYVPVLDDPFTIEELSHAVDNLNVNKSFLGICPGIFRKLPLSWLIFFLMILNFVFMRCCYPLAWCYSKLIILFKSGNRMICNNYRGISIMDTLAKIYDVLLLNRLKLWCHIDQCQAGAQKGRGCLEQIVALRLLSDYAKYKKVKLYVLFIDFSKAYDRVPRGKLMERLRSLGCGRVMLGAIKAMYKSTKNILKSATIDASIGVRQGAPSSCLLFVIYIDYMVRMIKRAVGNDGFLGLLHVLLLMDDAVIMATSREMCLKKLEVVLEFCCESGMKINEKKTKFFVVNGEECDKQCLTSGGITVNYTAQYLYLGAWFTDSSTMDSVMTLHETSSESIINKFSIFCASNTTMPFIYKRAVFDAAVTSALLYSSESWFTGKMKVIEKQYNKLVKCLLGVRKNTSINLCMIEAGIPPVQNIIAERKYKFIKSQRDHVDTEKPFHFVYNMCREANTPGYRSLERSVSATSDTDGLEKIATYVREKAAGATKLTTYITDMNPNMTVHPVYKTRSFVPDYKRESFTRLRLMSHNLRVEVGRWSRTPREQRVCQCDGMQVQTEKHVLIECPLSAHCRDRYQMLTFTDLGELLHESNYLNELCGYINDVQRIY